MQSSGYGGPGAQVLAVLNSIATSLGGIAGTLKGLAQVVPAPASATAAGTAGSLAYDSDYLYVCVATDTWKRVALATF